MNEKQHILLFLFTFHPAQIPLQKAYILAKTPADFTH